MPESYGLFPTPVVSFEIGRDFTKEELECIVSYSNNTQPSIMGNRTTLGENVLDNESLSDIRKFIHESLDWYVENIEQPENKFEVYLTQSFVNFISSGQGHHPHIHPNSYLSGVFYIQANPENDNITFINDHGPSAFFKFHAKKFNPFNSHMWTIPAWTGRLLLFPAQLPHQVFNNPNSSDRISLVFNTFIRGEIGLKEEYSCLTLK